MGTMGIHLWSIVIALVLVSRSATAGTVLYLVDAKGDLHRYVHHGDATGDHGWAANSGFVVGTSWSAATHVVAGSDGAIYAVINGDLYWYKDLGQTDGTVRWTDPKKIGGGWGGFSKVFAGPNGVLYAVATDGVLYWYRHLGWQDGAVRWVSDAGIKVGEGWGGFRQIAAANGGVIYAVDATGGLVWYRHTGQLDGTSAWDGPRKVGTGWANVIAGTQGSLYLVGTDGSLRWYRHLGNTTGAESWSNGSGASVGTGWSGSRAVFAVAFAAPRALDAPGVKDSIVPAQQNMLLATPAFAGSLATAQTAVTAAQSRLDLATKNASVIVTQLGQLCVPSTKQVPRTENYDCVEKKICIVPWPGGPQVCACANYPDPTDGFKSKQFCPEIKQECKQRTVYDTIPWCDPNPDRIKALNDAVTAAQTTLTGALAKVAQVRTDARSRAAAELDSLAAGAANAARATGAAASQLATDAGAVADATSKAIKEHAEYLALDWAPTLLAQMRPETTTINLIKGVATMAVLEKLTEALSKQWGTLKATRSAAKSLKDAGGTWKQFFEVFGTDRIAAYRAGRPKLSTSLVSTLKKVGVASALNAGLDAMAIALVVPTAAIVACAEATEFSTCFTNTFTEYMKYAMFELFVSTAYTPLDTAIAVPVAVQIASAVTVAVALVFPAAAPFAGAVIGFAAKTAASIVAMSQAYLLWFDWYTKNVWTPTFEAPVRGWAANFLANSGGG